MNKTSNLHQQKKILLVTVLLFTFNSFESLTHIDYSEHFVNLFIVIFSFISISSNINNNNNNSNQ